MSDHPELPEGEAPRWLDNPANGNKVFWAVVVAFLAFLVAGLLPLYERHPHFPFEELGFFSAIYGLACCIGLVLGATWLRTWLMRPEDYYDDE